MKPHTARIAAALAAALPLAAAAAIAPGTSQSGISAPYSGNGELFMAVFDAAAKISYALDLGLTQNDFLRDGTQDAGYQRFWAVDDANWTSFLGQVTRANLRWAVQAIDQTGGTAIGGVRWFTTVQQGDESKVIDTSTVDPAKSTALSTLTNQKFTNGMGGAQAGTFFNAVNLSGSHGVSGQALLFAENGSSVNADSDPGNAYFGDGSVGLSTTLNGNADFNTSNEVGKSSWFYYLTRSGANQLDGALVDEFDNLYADGYWGFVFVDPALFPNSPYVGKYLLSYTLAGTALTPAQRAFAQGIGRTEVGGGFSVQRLPGVAAATAGEAPALWQSQRLGAAAFDAPAMAPVPEPAAWALMAAGLGAFAAFARRRSAR